MAMKLGPTWAPWRVDGRNDISYGARVALNAGCARSYGFLRDLNIAFRTGQLVLKLIGKWTQDRKGGASSC